MDVPGPCSECHRPGILSTCPLCGALVCPNCLATGRHACAGRMGGPGRPQWQDEEDTMG